MTYSNEHVDGVLKHKEQVGKYMGDFSSELFRRAVIHDNSKFSDEEFKLFEESTPALKHLTYGSEEYKAALRKIKPAIDHHYSVNSHHPEYHKEGINDMDLFDIVEMLCDWMAAVKRHENGDIMKSLEINKERFGIDDQLYKILKTTAFAMTLGEKNNGNG
jgi:hypothetical protein